MKKKSLRKKSEILKTLPKSLSEGDRKHVRDLYASFGNIIKNGYPNENNPASYIGWLKLENGNVVKLEAEPRQTGDNITLAIKSVTIPEDVLYQNGLKEGVPDYVSSETKDFLNQ